MESEKIPQLPLYYWNSRTLRECFSFPAFAEGGKHLNPRLVFPGVKLSSLLGKKGSLDKLQSYWDVGFFLGASILAGDNIRVIQASEKLFKLKAPIW